MKSITRATLAALAVVSQILTGCGSGASSSSTNAAAPSPAALTGNWNIVGSRSLQQYPFLSLAVLVDGNLVTASGDFDVLCTSGLAGANGTPFLSGPIAANGSFTLNSGVNNPLQWTITGTAPALGGSTWTGTYTLSTLPAYTGCSLNQSGAFTAASLPLFQGTYTGTLTTLPKGSLTVSINVSQEAASVTNASPTTSYFPLSGTITVSGSPCFTSGTSSATPGGNFIEGDFVSMSFNMNDGSQTSLLGYYASPTDSSMDSAEFFVSTGACSPATYTGTLTHQ
jgi:hypothetical protein